ncbi:GNAT family N-acetyltransferase [Paenibacillus sp. FSL W7-1287]|uniref:GNAT family N-acetyltransferase n=1 Tax=Paenibacillus sp. FSL W7-1287 TaxID=2954538 RepID=UPI0030FBEEF0
MEVITEEYMISSDKNLLNYDVIYDLLSGSYWASHRSKERIVNSIEHSLCFGVYQSGEQIGFARVITDWSTMYWLCDVIIDERHRGKGIGKKLVKTIIGCEELRGLSGYLGTADAHGLYEQYGFERNAERFMAKRPK